MRRTARLLFLNAATALAVSATAQQSPQDFTLPEPTPTSTPQPQGPVDDTGVIPVGPRVIPTATPTPAPTETAPSQVAPAPVNTPPPRPVSTPPVPQATPASVPATRRPEPAPIETVPAPLPAAPVETPGISEPQAETTGSTAELPTLPDAQDSANTASAAPSVSAESNAGDFPWLYILGGLLALFAGVGGYLFWKRRAEDAPPPKIKRPVVDAALDQVGASAFPPRFEISFELEGINRSLMAVMVSGRVVVKNRGERAIRDIALLAELTSAHHPSAKTAGQLEEIATIERIGPHQSHREKVNFRLPLDEIAGLRRDGVPFFVPLLRLEAVVDGADPQRLDFVLGSVTPETGPKLQPLRLDGPPGAYQNLRGHALTA